MSEKKTCENSVSKPAGKKTTRETFLTKTKTQAKIVSMCIENNRKKEKEKCRLNPHPPKKQ